MDHIEPGSVLLADGLGSYPRAAGANYVLKATSIKGSGVDAHKVLPGVHRVTSLAKRWLLGTHQGSIDPTHVQAYLDEFTFRFSRRNSKARGMLFYRLLQQATDAAPVSYQALLAKPRRPMGKKRFCTPPFIRRTAPGSLCLNLPPRPWRRK